MFNTLTKFFSKKFLAFALASFVFVSVFSIAHFVQAQNVNTNYLFGGDELNAEVVRNATGLGDKDPREIAASVINVVLGFLGIIAVLLILAGGFRWMTAQGNDEAIAGAKNLMMAGVIGLIIILAAFGIARFVINALVDATT